MRCSKVRSGTARWKEMEASEGAGWIEQRAESQKPRPVGWGGTDHEGPLNHITESGLYYPGKNKEALKGSTQGVAGLD